MLSKKVKKLVWLPEENEFLNDNSKKMNLPELAKILNDTISTTFRKDSAVIRQCTAIGCGYTNKL